MIKKTYKKIIKTKQKSIFAKTIKDDKHRRNNQAAK